MLVILINNNNNKKTKKNPNNKNVNITKPCFVQHGRRTITIITATTMVKFMFSKKATKFDKIFTVNLTLTTLLQKKTNFNMNKRKRSALFKPYFVQQ